MALGFSSSLSARFMIVWCPLAVSDSEGQSGSERTPSSYQEFLFQLLGAGWLMLQGPAGEWVSSCAQKV